MGRVIYNASTFFINILLVNIIRLFCFKFINLVAMFTILFNVLLFNREVAIKRDDIEGENTLNK